MAGLTVADAEAQLAIWLAASAKVATGQAYEFADGRKLTRANLAEITGMIAFYDKLAKDLSGERAGGSVRIGRVAL